MAGLAGAGMGERRTAPLAAAGGAFSPLARAQYAALAAMRWQGVRNNMRSARGALEAAASGLNYILYAFMGLAIAGGLAAGAFAMVSNDRIDLLPLLLWAVFLMWQTLPVAIASFQQQFDLADLLRFPISFASFCLLQILFGLIDSTVILGCLGSVGIWIGVTLARPGLFAWTAAALFVFGVFNLLLSRAIFVWLDRWLAKRKTREIVSVLFLIGLLSFQLLNPAVRGRRPRVHSTPQMRAKEAREMALIDKVQIWLPPGLAAAAIDDSAGGRSAPALAALGFTGLWGLAAGLVLGLRLRALHRGEHLSDAPPRTAAKARVRGRPAAGIASLGGSGPVAAIIHKDVLTLLRSLPLLSSLGMPLVMVVVFASIMRGGAGRGEATPVALPLCIAYAIVGFTQFIYNNLGAEGAGIQLLFYSPTSMRTVLLAKNILHAALFSIVVVLAGLLAVMRLGMPPPAWLAVTAAWVVFSLPAHLAAGNLFSLNMPHRINLSRIGRQRGGQASALLGMLVQAGILGIGAVVAGLCAIFGALWLATPVLLALAVPACVAWLRVLAKSDAIATRRRDDLLTALAKVE